MGALHGPNAEFHTSSAQRTLFAAVKTDFVSAKHPKAETFRTFRKSRFLAEAVEELI